MNPIEAAVENYAEAVRGKIDEYWDDMGFTHPKNKVSVSYGKKYAKIISDGSVHSFVDMTNGNILKAASWKAPAKGIRGNIYRLEEGGFNEFGANYIRGGVSR